MGIIVLKLDYSTPITILIKDGGTSQDSTINATACLRPPGGTHHLLCAQVKVLAPY